MERYFSTSTLSWSAVAMMGACICHTHGISMHAIIHYICCMSLEASALTPHPQMQRTSSLDPSLALAILVRLGCLFQDFKSRPAFCAMYTAIKLGQKVAKGALLGVFYGLTAHTRPSVAFPILVAIIASQGLCLGLAAAYRPFISAFLNFLEVTCGALDVATLVITAIVYKHNQRMTEAAGPPGSPDQGFAKVSSPNGLPKLMLCAQS